MIVTRLCGWCGESFQRNLTPSDLAQSPRQGMFCNRSCSARARCATRAGRPSPAPPEAQIKTELSPVTRGEVVNRDCLVCGTHFTRRIARSQALRGSKGLYCSPGCAARSRYLETTKSGRRLATDPSHPLAGTTGRVLAYRKALYDRIGPGPHPCHWCGRLVNWAIRGVPGCGANDLAVDHLDHDRRNDAAENLVPSCNRCNTLRGFMTAWIEETGRSVLELLPTGE